MKKPSNIYAGDKEFLWFLIFPCSNFRCVKSCNSKCWLKSDNLTSTNHGSFRKTLYIWLWLLPSQPISPLMWGNYASIQLILLSSELVQLSVSGLTSPLAASRGIVIDAGPAQPSPSPVELFAGTAILCSNIVKQALTSVMKQLSTLSISVMNNLKASVRFFLEVKICLFACWRWQNDYSRISVDTEQL